MWKSLASAGPEYWLAATPAIKYDFPNMRARKVLLQQVLSRPALATRPSQPSPRVAILSLLLVIHLSGRFLTGAPEPTHEHLILGGDAQLARTALAWHQHTLVEPHSHPITGSVFEATDGRDSQVISYASNAASLISSYFSLIVTEILTPNGGTAVVPLFLVLSLGLATLTLSLSPGLAPHAPPPKPLAG